VLSVVDLRTYLGLDPTSLHAGRVLVVRLSDEELSLGLLVDRVDHIASVAADGVRPPESPLEGALAPYLAGIAHLAGRAAAVLDLDALLTSPDLRQFDDRKPE
jgi:chemotaxis signal transduction protein